MVSVDHSAHDVPENELGDAKDTFENSISVDNALETSLDRPGGAQTSSKDTSEDSSVCDALEKKVVCKDNAMPPINTSAHNSECKQPPIRLQKQCP